MNAVAKVGPIAIAVDASNWHSYESGIFNGCNQENPDINHGVVLVGYGEEDGKKYWIVRNSWSPNFGEKGYIRVARSNHEDKHCGLDITPQDGIACAGDDKPEIVRKSLSFLILFFLFVCLLFSSLLLLSLGLWYLWYCL
jgi:cathepsin L